MFQTQVCLKEEGEYEALLWNTVGFLLKVIVSQWFGQAALCRVHDVTRLTCVPVVSHTTETFFGRDSKVRNKVKTIVQTYFCCVPRVVCFC